ncbi:MAG: hypothetical protein J5908_08265 [Selenomonas sp.]|nr:hypothetical protein [Selenomonas sp.]
MLELGGQTKEAMQDENPAEGFSLLRQAGFSCADFSLNAYLLNLDKYGNNLNRFFDASVQELEEFWAYD